MFALGVRARDRLHARALHSVANVFDRKPVFFMSQVCAGVRARDRLYARAIPSVASVFHKHWALTSAPLHVHKGTCTILDTNICTIACAPGNLHHRGPSHLHPIVCAPGSVHHLGHSHLHPFVCTGAYTNGAHMGMVHMQTAPNGRTIWYVRLQPTVQLRLSSILCTRARKIPIVHSTRYNFPAVHLRIAPEVSCFRLFVLLDIIFPLCRCQRPTTRSPLREPRFKPPSASGFPLGRRCAFA